MEGVSRPAGSGVPIQWEGKTLILEPLGLKQWGEIEQHLLKLKPDPVQVAARIKKELAPLAPETEEKLTAEAYRDGKAGNFATEEEVIAFASSPRGLAFAIWLAFEKRYPKEYTLEETCDIIDSLSPEQQAEKFAELMQSSGLDERGNSIGRSRQQRRREQRAAKKKAPPDA